MGIDRDKESERAARLDWLIEEIRTKNERTQEAADKAVKAAQRARKKARAYLETARRKAR